MRLYIDFVNVTWHCSVVEKVLRVIILSGVSGGDVVPVPDITMREIPIKKQPINNI